MANGRRRKKVTEAVLAQFELEGNSPVWIAYEEAFTEMFSREDGAGHERHESTAIRLWCPEHERGNWDWYITQRLLSGKLGSPQETEKKLYTRLYGDHPCRLVYLHGHTGVGKTTLLRYFFSEYIPHLSGMSPERLKTFVPTNIPLAYVTEESIEQEWDVRVYDYLREQFEELSSLTFLRNVARHIAYPETRGRVLVMDEKGNLAPKGFSDHLVQSIEATIFGLDTVDPRDYLDWIDSEVAVTSDLSLGIKFNRPVIQVLAQHYGYEFTFLVDNIDDLPGTIQETICRLVNQKMRAYANYASIRFIIATRDNFLEPVLTQTYPAAQGFNHAAMNLPSLPFSQVLRARKKSFFDPLADKGGKWISLFADVGGAVVDLDGFMESVFDSFDNVGKLNELYCLANHNTRMMLDMVCTVFKSPHIDSYLLSDVLRAASRDGTPIRKRVGESFISTNRIIDAIVRGQNLLIARRAENLLPNVFGSGSSNHYSSSLCRVFVLAILIDEEWIPYGMLARILNSLGHPETAVRRAVTTLMEMKVIFSTDGYRLHEESIKRAEQPLETRDLPLAEYLLSDLMGSLRYLQGMAYVTPLHGRYLEMIKTPDKIQEPVRDLAHRLAAASALYKQLRADMHSQLQFARSAEDSSDLLRLMTRYGFCAVLENMHAQILNEHRKIRSVGTNTGIDIHRMFPAIQCRH